MRYLRKQALTVQHVPAEIDAVASLAGDTVYLNLVNTQRGHSKSIRLRILGKQILLGKGSTVADAPTTEISSMNCQEVMQPKDFELAIDRPLTLAPASVTSLELQVG